VIQSYLASYGGSATTGPDLQFDSRVGNGALRFTRLEFLDTAGTPGAVVRSGDGVSMRLHFRAQETLRHPSFGFRLFSGMGTLITESTAHHQGVVISSVKPGDGYVDIELDSLNLIAGRYGLSFWATSPSGIPIYDGDVRAALDLEQADVYGSGRALDSRFGIAYFRQRWTVHGPDGSVASV
jgi:hypothetical protein